MPDAVKGVHPHVALDGLTLHLKGRSIALEPSEARALATALNGAADAASPSDAAGPETSDAGDAKTGSDAAGPESDGPAAEGSGGAVEGETEAREGG